MVPTPAGTLGQTKENRKAASYPQVIVSELSVLRRLATDLVVVGLKALLEAAWGAQPQCFWPQLPGVPVLGGNGDRAEKGRRWCGGSKQTPPSADGCAG